MGGIALFSLFMIIDIHLGMAAEVISTISPSCDHVPSPPCVTLAQYVPSTSDNITVVLLHGDHILRSSVRIENKESFSLQGFHGLSSSRPVITCSQSSSADFELIRTNNFTLKDVILVRCYMNVVGTSNSIVGISNTDFHASHQDGRGLSIMSHSYVSIAGTTFHGHRAGLNHVSPLELNNMNYLEVSHCNFTDITTSIFSSVIELSQINDVNITWCNFKNMTVNRAGSIVELRNSIGQLSCCIFKNNMVGRQATIIDVFGMHASIINSTFTNNIGTQEHGSIVDIEHLDEQNSIISCSTFSNNNFPNRHNRLIKVSDLNYRSRSSIGGTMSISNSTFASNSMGNHSEIIECATTCTIISSVFKFNAVAMYGDYIRYDDRDYFDCYDGDYIGRKTQLSILASRFVHNYAGQYTNLISGENVVIDCTYFSAPVRQNLVDSAACNELLEVGAACENNCEGMA